MNSQTLFYSNKDYQDILNTLERLKRYIKCKFIIVGGIANRSLFPEWAETQKGRKFNDIDIVLFPNENEEDWIDKEIKSEFYVNFISKQKGGSEGYYFSMKDKETFVNVDIFTGHGDFGLQKISLGDHSYYFLDTERIYFGVLRTIYETLIRDWVMDPKHFDFIQFLEKKVDSEKLSNIWELEEPLIRFRKPDYEFNNFKEYIQQIEKLKNDKKSIIKVKIPGTGKPVYNSNSDEAFGITIDDEETFYKQAKLMR